MTIVVDIEDQIPLLEQLLTDWKPVIGSEYQGYRNHVYRMIHYCLALKDCTEEERTKFTIAAAFHDIGIWKNDTVDYIRPSLAPAMEYLKSRNLQDWSAEIELMITEHHKIRRCRDETYPLVEVFRKGDLVDFSFGLFRFGIAESYITEVSTRFPNAGFHKSLGKRAVKWFIRHPLNPLPMMKW